MKTVYSVLALATLVLAGCAPDAADRYHTAENEAEAVSLLNERAYEKAIWLIENQHGPVPNEPRVTFLLAQAYLGKAGFEALDFAGRVSGPQPAGPEELQELFPTCSRDRLANFSGVPVKCLVKRVYLQAPDADAPDFARARELLRRAYPDPAAAKPEDNTVIGAVETISVVSRAGKIYRFVIQQKKNPRFDVAGMLMVQKQVKAAEVEAKEALRRAQFAGEKISKLVSGVNGPQLFDRIKGGIKLKAETGIHGFVDRMPDDLEDRFGSDEKAQEWFEKVSAFLDENS